MLLFFVKGYSDVFIVFLGRQVHILNPLRCHNGWRQTDKFSKFAPPDTIKTQSLDMPVFHFLCKTFSKLLKLRLQKFFFEDDLSKLYIQII